MITKVVILVEQYFTDRDYSRYGIEILSKNNYFVKVWDLSAILWPKSVESIKKTSKSEFPNVIQRYKKMQDVLSDIKKETKETFFLSTIGYSYRTSKIFRNISLANLRYGCTGAHTTGVIPAFGNNTGVNRFFKYSPKVYLNALLNRMFSLKSTLNLLGIKLSVFFAIAGGENSSASGAIIGTSTKMVHIHAADYDLFLMKQNSSSLSKNIVYIDQYIPFHPDYFSALVNSSHNVNLYYTNLRNFFDKIEKLTGLNVIIAAHPKADYHNKEYLFGNRKIFHGFNSYDIISRSKLVLMHYSMAISQAVLLDKPIVFLTSDSFSKTIEGQVTANLAQWFNTTPLNMNKKVNDIELFFADKNRYTEYRKQYIKKPGTKEVNFWQQISTLIKEY